MMKLITGKILLFKIETTDGGSELRLYKAVVSKEKVSLWKEEYDGAKSLEKWKHSLALIFVTGNQVMTRSYIPQDITSRRITENQDLLYDITGEDGDSSISFVRKEILGELPEQLNKNHISLMGLFVGKQEELSIEERIRRFWDKEMTFSAVRKTPGRLNAVCNTFYYKLQLPVLIGFLLLLLGNYFINSHLLRENERLGALAYNKQRVDNSRKKETEKLANLTNRYNKLPDCSAATISDRIASYMPQGLTLNVLSIHPLASGITNPGKGRENRELVNRNIIVKGWSDIPGSITLFSQLLGKDSMFGKAEIVSLSRRKDADLFDFELQLTLSSN
ncbi:hypothetical protein [Bacteroides sp. UBA939]|uniref:hypothetical protein n=1 Tax=Bacteroides sp. UBA939 TaxID=1946092 RepID=UPI0025C0405F|nr:hypothetical protein [Bacteroides sp. UBA939]